MQSPSTPPAREDMQQRIEQFAGQVVTGSWGLTTMNLRLP
jgi:hypothetical protein